jgi:hypothetical protein
LSELGCRFCANSAAACAGVSTLISSIASASVLFTTESDRMASAACVSATRSSISKSREKVASEVGIMIAFGLPMAVTSTRPARPTAASARPG